MDKKFEKFLRKDNFVVALMKGANGEKKVYFGKRAKHEEVQRLSLAYCVEGKEARKRIRSQVSEEDNFTLAFDEKGKVVIYDGETKVTGGFKNDRDAKFLVLIVTENIVVILAYDARDMLRPCVLFAEGETQRTSYIHLFLKLEKMGFCKIEPKVEEFEIIDVVDKNIESEEKGDDENEKE